MSVDMPCSMGNYEILCVETVVNTDDALVFDKIQSQRNMFSRRILYSLGNGRPANNGACFVTAQLLVRFFYV